MSLGKARLRVLSSCKNANVLFICNSEKCWPLWWKNSHSYIDAEQKCNKIMSVTSCVFTVQDFVWKKNLIIIWLHACHDGLSMWEFVLCFDFQATLGRRHFCSKLKRSFRIWSESTQTLSMVRVFRKQLEIYNYVLTFQWIHQFINIKSVNSQT